MPDWAWVIGLWLAAYLVGAIPFGYLVARMRGVDIFREGSGNIGATNVGRVLGKKFGALVLLLDVAKGAGPVLAALALKPTLTDAPYWAFTGWLEVGAGMATILGHIFPVYLRFRGGKGVATGAGVVVVLFPLETLGAFLAWVLVLLASRYVSLASIVAAIVLSALHGMLAAGGKEQAPLLFCFFASALVIIRHYSNIGRLLRGTENQVKETEIMRQVSRVIHVLAMGLWFGSGVFFTFVVGLSLFSSFEQASQLEKKDRPVWFPLPAEYEKIDANIHGPREQGTRAAGYAVAPMFPLYFVLQVICGFLASATAASWSRSHPTDKVHRWRSAILLTALITVMIGWPLERKVSDLRDPRNQATDLYLLSRAADATTMKNARSEFGRWHLYSLLLNFVTLLLVTGGMALTVKLPESPCDTPAK